MNNDYYYIPERTGLSFEERVGPPDPCDAAIGRVVISFDLLQRSVATAVSKCLDFDPTLITLIAVNPRSAFLANVRFLTCAVRRLTPTRKFNAGPDDPIAAWRRLAAHCVRSEQKWQVVLTLNWSHLNNSHRTPANDVIPGPGNVTILARRKRYNAAEILDLGDYMLNAVALVDEFFLVP